LIVGNTYFQLHIHVVFAVAGRRTVLTEKIAGELHAYLGGAFRSEDATASIVGGYDDHIHALIGIRPAQRLSDLMRNVKANSSAWLTERMTEPHKFAWQRGYAAFSVSHSQLDKVRAYIANQREHHRSLSFADELRNLLKKHGVSFEEAYLLDDS
jgi:REP element-mobilizing transposase RayT